MTLAGVAVGLDVEQAITLDGSQDYSDVQLDMKYSTNKAQSITTTVDSVTIKGMNGYGLNTADTSLTFNIQNELKATGTITLVTAGATGNLYVNTSITDAELATLESNEKVSRWVISADFIANIPTFVTNDRISLTLDGLTGYKDGGLIYDLNGTYYNTSDVSYSGNGNNYVTINQGAKALNLEAGTIYTTLKITAGTGASVKGIGYVALIPEPATATLSLLALAGLAARRRRR